MSKELNLLVVTAGLCVNFYTFHSLRYIIPMTGYGGHLQYLPVWGLIIATLAFLFRILNLLTGAFTVMYESFIAIATPLEGVLSILYWSLSLYQKNLVSPLGSQVKVPLILDISLHLIPTVVCWVDFLVFNKKFKKSPSHILSMYVLAMSYFVWVNKCFEQNNYWPYPLFGNLTDMQRSAFFLSTAWVCSNLYKIIVKCHGLLNADNDERAKQDIKKKQ